MVKHRFVARVGKDGVLFYCPSRVGDVGHTLVIGPPGAGKSTLLNFFALQQLKTKNARVIIIEIDKSAKYLCENMGGRYYEPGDEKSGYFINPFYDIADSQHRVWLSEFLTQYFKMKNVPVPPYSEGEIYKALTVMSSLKNPADRTFQTFHDTIQIPDLREAIKLLSEKYGHIFKAECDDFENNNFLCFELRSLLNQGEDIAKFVMGYLFQKIERLFKGDPTLFNIDEGWRLLDDPYSAARMRDYLKTTRKKNVDIVLSTQELADLKQSPIFSTITNACMTRFFLPNPSATEPENKRLYEDMGLTESDIRCLKTAEPKKDYFYQSPHGKQAFDLHLCKKQLDILTKDVRRAQ